MENAFAVCLSIALDIVLGESSFKIALKFLTFFKIVVRIWDPIPIEQ